VQTDGGGRVKGTGDISRLKRFAFWQLILLPTYALVAGLLGLFSIRDTWLPVARAVAAGGYDSVAFREASAHGPTTTAFNHRMRTLSLEGRLVGSGEQRVAAVLGTPDYVRHFWEVIGADGVPPLGSEYLTTYEYYPYPNVPVAKFQVHCVGGVVRSIEMFDD
jgi:hypothetical protein